MLEEEKREESEYLVLEPTARLNLSRSQKIAVTILVVFGIFIVVVWFMQFKANLNNSLKHSTGNSTTVDSSISDNSAADEARQKTQDTDGDGLSDWDELNVYHTSPYLEDSDSDGYSDKKEIDSNNDPNCPMGQTCLNTETSLSVASSTSGESMGADVGNNTSVVTSNSANQVKNTGQTGQIDIKTLRLELEKSGLDKTMLDSTSDSDLLKIYQEALSQQNNN